MLTHYLISYDPRANPFGSSPGDGAEGKEATSWWRHNPVDAILLGGIRRAARSLWCRIGRNSRWAWSVRDLDGVFGKVSKRSLSLLARC